jgi:hypothetical protein
MDQPDMINLYGGLLPELRNMCRAAILMVFEEFCIYPARFS